MRSRDTPAPPASSTTGKVGSGAASDTIVVPSARDGGLLGSPLAGTIMVTAVSFVAGGAVLLAGHKTLGMLGIYFGAQSGFNLYMKIVLSNTTVSQELGLEGVPAAFFLTALQQLVSFVVSGVAILVLRVSPARRPFRTLTTAREWRAVAVFSVAFAANHGFNNFSLSLLEVSLNLVLRCCVPLATVLLQAVFLWSGVRGHGASVPKTTRAELACMFAGVLFAAMATLSEGWGGNSASQHVALGSCMAVISLFFAALNMLAAAELGSDLKVDPLDATCYCALPAAACLTIPMMLLQHPVWPGLGRMTDWQVMHKVLDLSPQTMSLVFVSGLMSVFFSLLQYWLIINLSAAYTAFAGNFNKALCVLVSISIGLEHFPTGAWRAVMAVAIAGNAAAFTGYGLLRHAPGGKAAAESALCAGDKDGDGRVDGGRLADERLPGAQRWLQGGPRGGG